MRGKHEIKETNLLIPEKKSTDKTGKKDKKKKTKKVPFCVEFITSQLFSFNGMTLVHAFGIF